ncbi:hypothetical protein PVK06_048158 [Gossypium arboreum]|uniref:Uncharacterized protein n=1 Tax=Gossypium arboreum TaxID=29729 RepID=A0ABR0MH60_GOSAR|nr:hypothetical protein PVK06_048158 [Gossypium arboreum]
MTTWVATRACVGSHSRVLFGSWGLLGSRTSICFRHMAVSTLYSILALFEQVAKNSDPCFGLSVIYDCCVRCLIQNLIYWFDCKLICIAVYRTIPHVHSSGRVSVQELEVNAISPSTGSDNPELDTEALTRVVREVLEKVFEARIRGPSEMLQVRCVDCGKKRDQSPPRLEPRSVKHVRTHLSDKSSCADDAGSGARASFF